LIRLDLGKQAGCFGSCVINRDVVLDGKEEPAVLGPPVCRASTQRSFEMTGARSGSS
jgi:hypothetical protein